ncbi:MAG: hypothetical protein ACTHYR_04335 [Brachybacterium sp.]
MESSYERLVEADRKRKLHPYWGPIERQLDTIEERKLSTSREILDLLGGSEDTGYFAGSGGDRELLESLSITGWAITEYHASYYWTVQHPLSGDSLEYIEGDVYDRTHK